MVHPITLQRIRTICGVSDSRMCRKVENAGVAKGPQPGLTQTNPTPLMLSLSKHCPCSSCLARSHKKKKQSFDRLRMSGG